MTELEKFKRRMIRMVARLHVQQKKPEHELWEYLRKQTKCDCKWLWERMRALTLKRLKRLIIAEDRQENIPAVARMSLTDWLLFDCILVHENIDVIGSELMSEGRTSEPRPMFDLFSLVQKFELEGLRGEELARAWTAATVSYNSGGRQCSPMLLQRRWYQLKQTTRSKFYKFWFSYRGNAKLLLNALQAKPTRLQAAVARRYPHVITMPFLSWEELIEKHLIIMPPEFEIQMKSRSGQLPKPIDDNDADLVLLEPEIETIDLGVDSDSDVELRDEVEGSKAEQMIAEEDASAVQGITLKQEPVDEDEHIEEDINLDSAHMDAIDAEIDNIEGIEALEKMEIPIQIEDEKPKPPEKKKKGRKKKLPAPIEIEDDDSVDTVNTMGYTDEDSRCSVGENVVSNETESLATENIIPASSTDEAIASSTIVISSSPTGSLRHIDIKPETDVSMATEDAACDYSTTSHTETPLPDRISPVAVIVPKEEAIEVSETSITGNFDRNVDESLELPQITNVFGNVSLPDEDLQKLSNYLEKTTVKTLVTQDQDIEIDEIEEDIIKTEITDSSNATNVDDPSDVQAASAACKIDENSESKIKANDEKFQDNLLDDAIPDMTFEDDGIEFIDDGIVEEQDGEKAMNAKEHGYKEFKQESLNDKEKAGDESQSIDLKLIMVPVVYTRKLEHMDVLRNKDICHVEGEVSIELILFESRPVSKKSIQIKDEPQPEDESVTDDDEDAHDDLFDKPDDSSTADSSDGEDDSIPEEKKVSISSVLFKKPPNREYGPLTICKNPDFNTRLKRLTVSFLSYTRNRFLLTACKPLTIDLCKAFENKLVNNTVYLKQTPGSEIMVKKEEPERFNENVQTPPVVTQENLVPSTTEVTTDVQTLVNKMLEKALPPSAREPVKDISKEMEEKVDAIVERNKVIVLPNIDNVRRINQKLLVAEVSPMRMESTSHVPPVSLVSSPMEKLNLPISDETPAVEKPIVEKPKFKGPDKDLSSGTVICSGQVINNVSQVTRGYRGNGKVKVPWRPDASARVSRGFWDVKKPASKPAQRYDDQLLLSVDTLNKMLNIVHQKDPIANHEQTTYKKNFRDKQRHELQRKVNEIQKMLTGENSRSDNDEAQDTDIQTPGTNKRTGDETKPFDLISSKAKRGRPVGRGGKTRKRQKVDFSNGYGTYCCWIKFKQNHPRSMNVHPCNYPHCTCCCRKGTESETDPSIKKVCESIESVIEQSREIAENENKDGAPTNFVTLTNVSTTNQVTEENNVIDITDGDNDSSENTVFKDNVRNKSNQNCDSESNYEIVDSNVLGLTGIENNQVGNSTPGLNSDENTVEQTVAANITITTVHGESDPSASADDCVVIDSDEPETSEKQISAPPPLKITIKAFPQETPVKRKRGRPLKLPQPIPKAPPPPITIPKNRYNLRPIPKKQNEQDNNVLFLNSNHIRRSNHPIFLGQNKILLTDVQLPRNKDKPVESEPSPALINTTLPLPQGVNLMLLPNGVLTCTVDPNVQLTTEELTNLGAIIDNIQRQISSAITGVMDPAAQVSAALQIPLKESVPPLVQPMPTITVPDITQNVAVNNLLDDENDAQKSIDDNTQTTTSTAESAERTANITSATESVNSTDSFITTSDTVPAANESNSSDSVKVTESTATETDNNSTAQPPTEQKITESTPMETEDTSTVQPSNEQPIVSETPSEPKASEIPIPEPNVSEIPISEPTVSETPSSEPTFSKATDTVPALDITNDSSNINADNDKHNSEAVNISAVQDTEEVKNAETEPVNKKTILSDLMEMSGIFEEDMAPVDPTPPVPEVPQYPIAPEPTIIIPPPSLPSPVPNPTNALPELTPITSFAELKYACAHNGNFFKLDLETKSLTPINVCIKKKTSDVQPKQFVDLTDDADDDDNHQNVTMKPYENIKKKVVATHFGDMPVYVIRKKVQDTSPSKQLLPKQAEPAKPLKLFKVVHPFGTDVDKGFQLASGSNERGSLRKVKRSRKQNLAEQVFETPTLNFLTNEEEKEDYEFDGSFEDTVAVADDSDDSSDDEPLAKKVRRKEEEAKEAELAKQAPAIAESNEANAEPAADSVPGIAQDETQQQNENKELPFPVEQLDLPPAELEEQEEESEMLVEELDESCLEPTELEFLSDNEEEDCILGV